jgi:hypothetical protein
MNNIVDEIEVLKNAINLEEELREATDLEMRNNIEMGPMRVAHDDAVNRVAIAARSLVAKFDGE